MDNCEFWQLLGWSRRELMAWHNKIKQEDKFLEAAPQFLGVMQFSWLGVMALTKGMCL